MKCLHGYSVLLLYCAVILSCSSNTPRRVPMGSGIHLAFMVPYWLTTFTRASRNNPRDHPLGLCKALLALTARFVAMGFAFPLVAMS